MIRLLIADDHAIVRGGLRQLFELDARVQIVGEATTGADVLACLSRGPVDLLLLDLNMPGLSGAALITQVLALHGNVPILVFSMDNEPLVAARMLKAGAHGYITKDCEPEALLTAVRKVAARENYISPEIASQMAFAGAERRSAHSRLSEREMTVFRRLAQGLCVKEIGAQLHISGKTVSTHKARLMEKLGTPTMADLVRYAIAHDLQG